MSLDPTLPSVDAFENPYAAPGADLLPSSLDLDGDLAGAEAIRREHINHEAAVRSVGSLFLLGGILLAIVTIVVLLIAAGVIPSGDPGAEGAQMLRIVMGAVGALYLLLTVLNLSVGIGLRKLKPWARWTTVGLLGLSLAGVLFNVIVTVVMTPTPEVLVGAAIGFLIGGGINGYMLYLMLAPKSSMVFSQEYKVIISKTPHVKYRTSKLLIALLILIVVIIVIAVVAAGIGGKG